MHWEVGQRVVCDAADWGPCHVTMSSERLVVVYCPRYELVTTGSPEQLERAGWRLAEASKVVWMEQWSKGSRSSYKLT